jgi:hypothetical protein
MAEAKNVKFEGFGFHSVDFKNNFELTSEEVYLYFSATWLGKEVRFVHKADRYRHSSGLSEWRAYVSEGWSKIDSEYGWKGDELSSTARAALNAASKQYVEDWLISEAYRESYRSAVYNAILRCGAERYRPWEKVRSALKAWRMWLSTEREATLHAYADALEAADYAEVKARELAGGTSNFNSYTWTKVDAE